MDLGKIIVELRYKKPAHPFTFRSKIIKQITGSELNNNLQIQEGITIQIRDKKAKLVIEPHRWAVSIEQIGDINDLVEYLQSLYGKIYSAVQWKEGVRIGVRTMWLQEYGESFEQLVSHLKGKIFKESQLINESADIALPLTFYDGESRVNYTTGPMKQDELAGRFENKVASDFPEVSLFLDVDYIARDERVYDKTYFRKILNTAITYATNKAQVTEQELL